MIVSIDKKYPKHAQKVMNAIWGAHMMSLTKLIVVVDADCDVHDYHEVAWRALATPTTAATWSSSKARSTTSTTPPTSSSGAARPVSTPPASCPRRATPATAAGPRWSPPTRRSAPSSTKRWKEYGL